MIARRQLNELGIDHDLVRNQVRAGRWTPRSPRVVSTTTGPLSREQLQWLGVLHAGGQSLVGGLSAAEVHGLQNWHRDEITVYVEEIEDLEPMPGISFQRTRRSLGLLRATTLDLPVAKLEPAILIFGACQHSPRTAQGVLAAAVQQGLTTPDLLQGWVNTLRPLRRAPLLRRALTDIAGGSQSVAELDVVRLCRQRRLRRPDRQTKRQDAGGRSRWTDCEWQLPDGRVLVLEVDGSFHMDVEHWEDDLARQRELSSLGRLIVRCTARELRDDPDRIARDLIALGVPAA